MSGCGHVSVLVECWWHKDDLKNSVVHLVVEVRRNGENEMWALKEKLG